MGFFSKKKENAAYQDAFNNMNQPESTKTAQERILFDQTTNKDDGVRYAELLMQGTPLCIDFSELDVDDSNKIIAFLSGVLYAIGGEVRHVQKKAFLFARRQDFLDGTLQSFLSQF